VRKLLPAPSPPVSGEPGAQCREHKTTDKDSSQLLHCFLAEAAREGKTIDNKGSPRALRCSRNGRHRLPREQRATDKESSPALLCFLERAAQADRKARQLAMIVRGLRGRSAVLGTASTRERTTLLRREPTSRAVLRTGSAESTTGTIPVSARRAQSGAQCRA